MDEELHTVLLTSSYNKINVSFARGMIGARRRGNHRVLSFLDTLLRPRENMPPEMYPCMTSDSELYLQVQYTDLLEYLLFLSTEVEQRNYLELFRFSVRLTPSLGCNLTKAMSFVKVRVLELKIFNPEFQFVNCISVLLSCEVLRYSLEAFQVLHTKELQVYELREYFALIRLLSTCPRIRSFETPYSRFGRLYSKEWRKVRIPYISRILPAKPGPAVNIWLDPMDEDYFKKLIAMGDTEDRKMY